MIDYSKQNKPVQVGMRVIDAGYDTGLGLDPTAILSAAGNVSSSGSAASSVISGASAGASMGTIVPGVGTVIGGAVGAVTGIVGKLFGGGKKPKDPTGDGGVANATAINQQRDTVLNSDIYKYYVTQGYFPSLGPGAGPTYLSPPGSDAFGNAAQVLRQLAEVIEQLKSLIKAEPIVQKHMYAVDNFYSEYRSIGGVFGPMTGSGNVPEAIRNLNNVLRIVAEAETAEAENAIRVATVLANEQARKDAEVALKVRAEAEAKAAADAALTARLDAEARARVEAERAAQEAAAQKVQVVPIDNGTTRIGGINVPVGTEQGAAQASLLGIPNEMIAKFAGVATALLVLGFILSPKGALPPARIG